LLQIILIGQPELNRTLERNDLRPLAQRVTARYHLQPLSADETNEYIRFRLAIAGGKQDLFTRTATRLIHRYAAGVPRLINVLCDRALLGTYTEGQSRVSAATVRKAAREVLGTGARNQAQLLWYALAASVLLAGALLWFARPVATPVITATSNVQPNIATNAAPLEPTADLKKDEAREPPAQDQDTQPPVTGEAGEPPAQQASVAAPDAPEPDLLDVMQQGKTDAGTALGALLHYWGVQLTDASATDCEQVAAVGFRCLRNRGTWNNLRNLNRAVVLTLRGPAGKHYVLLTGLSGDNHVTISIDQHQYQFPLQDIDRYWFGEYLLLWRPPPLITQPIARYSKGPDVLWLRQALSRVSDQGPAFDVNNPEFDQQLHDRIIGFQREHALDADGIVGVETLIKLNTYLRDKNTPFLVPPTG